MAEDIHKSVRFDSHEGWVSFIEVGGNLFLFEFQKEKDWERVINGSSKSFDTYLVWKNLFIVK